MAGQPRLDTGNLRVARRLRLEAKDSRKAKTGFIGKRLAPFLYPFTQALRK
jgi:hypothetical protein